MTLLPPTPEQLKEMNYELDQNPATLKQDVKKIREWLSKQPHLPETYIDDKRIENFLHGCKYSLERTKSIMDSYYTVRAGVPEFFEDRDPFGEDVQKSIRDINYAILPKLSPKGYRVTVMRLKSTDPHNFDFPALVKRIILVLDTRMQEERCLNNVNIFDLHGFTVQHFAKCLPTLPIVRKAMLCVQDSFPMRIAQVHFTNCPPFIEKILAVFAPLLKEKLVQKFIFHTSNETLYDHFPRDILPKEYGGDAGPLGELSDDWAKKIESYRTFFLHEQKYSKADESKRQIRKTSKTMTLLLDETQGSFRQLSID